MSTILNIVFSVNIFLLSSSILIINHGVVSPTLHVNLTLFVVPCKFFFKGYRFSIVLQILSLEVNFHPIFIHS